MMNSGRTSEVVQNGGMLSKEQLIYLFSRFSYLTSQPDVKKRISDAVKDKQEAVAITTAIQEEILNDMGVDPRFGIACLGKVNHVYENDQDLMIKFYGFVAKEEIVCDEAELEPDELAEKMHFQHKLQEQQLQMLKHMRKFHPDDQSEILEKLRKQMENAKFDNNAAVLTSSQIQEIIRKKALLPFTNAR
ncbi:uncharacterized protein LOC113276635 isoform X2 [Papaver somniferum]|uniref:uncharacterized protein LOC113276635 isoform X2 n=1 Tax=Papaver somniferum TaxID=3469 RepID=UPI000E6F4B78|nr:uncharacterized protein LOC113276635 isoform X2 [Papaver somniferum]